MKKIRTVSNRIIKSIEQSINSYPKAAQNYEAWDIGIVDENSADNTDLPILLPIRSEVALIVYYYFIRRGMRGILLPVLEIRK